MLAATIHLLGAKKFNVLCILFHWSGWHSQVHTCKSEPSYSCESIVVQVNLHVPLRPTGIHS